MLYRNGTLKEYIGPDISKEDFHNRLIAALDNETSPTPPSQPVGNDTPETSTSSPAPVPASQPQPKVETKASTPTGAAQQASQAAAKIPKQSTKPSPKETKSTGPSSSLSQSQTASRLAKFDKGKAPMGTKKPAPKVTEKQAAPAVEQNVKPAVPRGPPSQYRLQVRLFDGRSVRSSFTPTQSIKNDVRPWLDQQMEEDTRPYNLKQILNPLPSETLSVAQESQTLRDLGIGSTANLVMVPVSTYTEAYSAAGSLPVRGVSAIYGLASSAASTATGLVSSFLGYGSAAPTPESTPASEPSGSTQRSRPSGPNIRTLRDQQDGRGDSQLYNGNQVSIFSTYTLVVGPWLI